MKELKQDVNSTQGVVDTKEQTHSNVKNENFNHEDFHEKHFSPFQTAHGAEVGCMPMIDVHE